MNWKPKQINQENSGKWHTMITYDLSMNVAMTHLQDTTVTYIHNVIKQTQKQKWTLVITNENTQQNTRHFDKDQREDRNTQWWLGQRVEEGETNESGQSRGWTGTKLNRTWKKTNVKGETRKKAKGNTLNMKTQTKCEHGKKGMQKGKIGSEREALRK